MKSRTSLGGFPVKRETVVDVELSGQLKPPSKSSQGVVKRVLPLSSTDNERHVR
jgi:hypothetical protein